MSRELRQSTAQTELIGPFLDVGDGFTEETGLTPPTEIAKDGAAYAAGPTGGTHDSDGWYPVAFTTAHTDTLGTLMLKSHDNTTHLPVWHEFEVVTANYYDSKYGTDTREADVTQWLGTAVPAPGTAGVPSVDATHVDGTSGAGNEVADKVWDELVGEHQSVGSFGAGMNALFVGGGAVEASGSNSTTQVQTTLVEGTNDHYVGGVIVFVDNLEKGQSRVITGYTAITGVVTWEPALTGIPAAGDKFVLLGVGHNANLRTATQVSIDAVEADTADMQPKIGTPAADLAADIAAVPTANENAAAIGPQINVALSDLEFLMVLSSDGQTPATGLTVTGQRSINGGAFVAVAGAIAEVGNGLYQIDATAADMNGALLTFRFSAATALDTFVTIKTTPA